MRGSTQSQPSAYQHAIVIGGSIAGLITARVLRNHFAQVTIIERDGPPSATAFRGGAPQARHPHVLFARGQNILEAQFPGIVQEMLAAGAVPFYPGHEFRLFANQRWVAPFPSDLVCLGCSRPLLESAIYRRLAADPQVRMVHHQSVAGLCTDGQQTRATGVHLRARATPDGPVTTLAADLVVDASGRTSQAPTWLADLGYTPPQETTVNAFPGYSTRIYRPPANASRDWQAMYIMAMPPHTPRGAVILPMEADEHGPRWHVSLTGMNGDYPPTDEAGFLDFARSLATPLLYEAIKQAEPLTAPYGYRQAENRMRYYEKLPRYLENFLVTGDALYAFNPVYGQGMTTAALVSETLDACLTAHRRGVGEQALAGLAQRFQKAAAGVIAGPWQMATGQDARWPGTAGSQAPDPVTRLVQRYLDQVLNRMPDSTVVAEAFFQVQNMLKPPTSLFHPRILWQVLKPPGAPNAQPVTLSATSKLLHAR